MKFEEKDLEYVSLDYNDDWQPDKKNKTCSVMVDGLENIGVKALGLSDEDIADDHSWYIDTYLNIDPIKEAVVSVYFKYTAELVEDGKETEVEVDEISGRKLVDKLRDNGEFDEFLASCKKEVA